MLYAEYVVPKEQSLYTVKLSEPLQHNVILSKYTTFRVGGKADIFAQPHSAAELQNILAAAQRAGIPIYILGGGSNIVVSDKGIRGLVIYTGRMNTIKVQNTQLYAESGASITAVSTSAANNQLGGLDFIYSMPGSVGGAVWMNARCYGSEISHILHSVQYVNLFGDAGTYIPRAQDFLYKLSPFQDGKRIITAVVFQLFPADTQELWKTMKKVQTDRTQKGHFHLPCAGSIFKNNRAFGAPSGEILDSLQLRNMYYGGAKVSEKHANIIVNDGTATALDIRRLVTKLQHIVYTQTNKQLETEILFVGDWDEH